MTADIDLYVDLEKVNASRFRAAMKALGFVPGVPVLRNPSPIRRPGSPGGV
jgi:hypothetical protein